MKFKLVGEYQSLRQVVESMAESAPDSRVFKCLDEMGHIFNYTAKDVYDEVSYLGDGLLSILPRGSHIAIVAGNSCRYRLSDIAITGGVGVSVPICKDVSNSRLAGLLEKSYADAVICSVNSVKKIQEIRHLCSRLKTLITIDKPFEGCYFYEDIVEKGANVRRNSVFRKIKPDPEATAQILFSNWETGVDEDFSLTNAELAVNVQDEQLGAFPENLF